MKKSDKRNKFIESLDPENFEGDEELRKLAEKAQIHPLLPTKYNAMKREELRKFEQELLKKGKDIELDF